MSTTPAIPPADIRSYNQKLLDQIRALIIGKALDDVSSYKIGTRELVKIPLMELRAWEAEIEGRVRRELRRKQGLPRQNVGIIFGSAEPERPRFAAGRLFLGRALSLFRVFDRPSVLASFIFVAYAVMLAGTFVLAAVILSGVR